MRTVSRTDQRIAATVTATLLTAALGAGAAGAALAATGITVAVGTALATTATLGFRRSPYRPLVAAIRKRLPETAGGREPEVAARFAQTLGASVLGAGAAAEAFGVSGAATVGAAVVAALSTLLAASGICLGCRLYGLVARLERAGSDG